MDELEPFTDQQIFACTIEGEAGGEGSRGWQAVANVVMNRANNPNWWGEDVRSVCLKPYQFSCWNQSDPNRARIVALAQEGRLNPKILDIADRAIAGVLPDITGSANSYFSTRLSDIPAWARHLEPTARIGHHVFYRTQV